MLGGVVVGTKLGVEATVLYLAFYLAMNLAAFAVIASIERDDGITEPVGDDISALNGLGRQTPWLAVPMTIAMLALAGIPGTVGFIGKFQLIHALVDGDYTWLGIVLVIGSMISLGYYLRVVAAMWMSGPSTVPASAGPPGGAAPGIVLAPVAGGSPEADEDPSLAPPAARSPLAAAATVRHPEIVFVAVLFSAACIFFGIVPGPVFHLATHAGNAFAGLF
jgi:NADH-quinone oxidoreductase subunit N